MPGNNERKILIRTDLQKITEMPDGTSANNIPSREYTEEEWGEEVKKMEELNKSSMENEWTPPISIEELCKKEFPPMKWVVENMFAQQTINQISAQPDQRKTWIVLHMAICIAKGEKVFNYFNTEQQGVMVVNEEDPDYLLKDRLKMLLDDSIGLPIYFHIEKGIMINDKDRDETIDTLMKEMRDYKCSVIIFDSLSMIHNANENDATEMNNMFRQMKRFTREGFTVIFTNHHRKKSRGGYKDDSQEQTRGSTVINAVPAGHITCEEKKSGNETSIIIRQVKLKSAKKLNPFLVNVKEVDGKISFLYEDEYLESVDAKTKLRQELYDMLQGSDIWLGIADFSGQTKRRSSKPIREELKALVSLDQIQREARSELIKKGFPISKSDNSRFLYFKLPPLEDEETT